MTSTQQCSIEEFGHWAVQKILSYTEAQLFCVFQSYLLHFQYCMDTVLVTCMVTILRLVRLFVIPTYIGIIAPGQRDFSSSLFKCFLGSFTQGDWRETSTTTAESFQHQQVFLTAYALPHAVRSPGNIIQKCKTQTLVLCTHKSRFIFLHFSDGALSS